MVVDTNTRNTAMIAKTLLLATLSIILVLVIGYNFELSVAFQRVKYRIHRSTWTQPSWYQPARSVPQNGSAPSGN